MIGIDGAPPSCRTCAFLVKCFSKADLRFEAPPPPNPRHWASYPSTIANTVTQVTQAGRAGPGVVFLHALGGTSQRWRSNMNAVMRSGRVAYSFDLPWHGLARTAGQPADLMEITAAVEDFLRVIDDPVTIVAAGSAALVAVSVLARSPELANILVLASAIDMDPSPEALRRQQRLLSHSGREEARERLRRQVLDGRAISDDLVEQEYRAHTYSDRKTAMRAIAGQLPAAHQRFPASLRAVSDMLPVHLIWGEHDQIVAPGARNTLYDLVGGQVGQTVIPGAGHLVNLEQPGAFNQALLALIA